MDTNCGIYFNVKFKKLKSIDPVLQLIEIVMEKNTLNYSLCEQIFHFIYEVNITKGLELALKTPHNKLHNTCVELILKGIQPKESKWWFFTPKNGSKLCNDQIIDSIIKLNLVYHFSGTVLEERLMKRVQDVEEHLEKAINDKKFVFASTLKQTQSHIPTLFQDFEIGARLINQDHYGSNPKWRDFTSLQFSEEFLDD